MKREPSSFMPPNKRTIIAPDGGWKAETLYIVEVAYSQHNPVHLSMLYVGFLQVNGQPGPYTVITNPCSDNSELHEVHYLKVVDELPEEFQIYRHEEEEWVDG